MGNRISEPEEGEKLRATDNMGQCNVFFFCVLHIFQNFPCTLGEKSKSVSFSRVYVCVKAKLTLVSFFFTFFIMHLSLRLIFNDFCHSGLKTCFS